MKLTYGDGKLWTQQGLTADKTRCLLITKIDVARPINSTPKEWSVVTSEDDVDVILEFKNIESARTLQDELNELIAKWSKEQSQIVDTNT